MASITPFILDELPTPLTPSALYFIAHPLNVAQMQVYLATSDGSTAKCVFTTSPIANMQPSLYDSTTVTYTGTDLTSKKFYLGGIFIGKVTYTYTSGTYTGSTYSVTP